MLIAGRYACYLTVQDNYNLVTVVLIYTSLQMVLDLISNTEIEINATAII